MRPAPTRLVPALAVALAGCGGMPAELAFEGAVLERGSEWSRGGLTGVVYVPPGQTLPAASLQVGFIVSETHSTGEELMRAITEQYHRAPVNHFYEEVAADEACRIGAATVGEGVRPFVTLQLCRHAGGLAGCAEADEEVGDDVMATCLGRGDRCWDEECYQRWESRRQSLEPLLMAFLGES